MYAVMTNGSGADWVRRCATVLSQVLEFSRKRGLIDNNPTKGRHPPEVDSFKAVAFGSELGRGGVGAAVNVLAVQATWLTSRCRSVIARTPRRSGRTGSVLGGKDAGCAECRSESAGVVREVLARASSQSLVPAG